MPTADPYFAFIPAFLVSLAWTVTEPFVLDTFFSPSVSGFITCEKIFKLILGFSYFMNNWKSCKKTDQLLFATFLEWFNCQSFLFWFQRDLKRFLKISCFLVSKSLNFYKMLIFLLTNSSIPTKNSYYLVAVSWER